MLTPKDVAIRCGKSEKYVRHVARELLPRHEPWSRWSWETWDDPDLRRLLDRLENGHRAGEPRREWDLTISAKNQVTLPVAALRSLRAAAGDKLRAVVRGRSLVLLPHPVSWTDYYAGVAEGAYGQTDEEVELYLRESRGEWEPVDE